MIGVANFLAVSFEFVKTNTEIGSVGQFKWEGGFEKKSCLKAYSERFGETKLCSCVFYN